MLLRIRALLYFVIIGYSAYAQHSVPVWKTAFATEVLQRVGATYGFSALDLPKLVLFPRKKGNNRIAYLELLPAPGQKLKSNLDRSRLLMDEELFDICVGVDKGKAESGTSLAFVMAHEMAHFYLNHSTYRNFADRRQTPIAATESYRQENEADKTGLLFAYLSGYDPEPVLDLLFNRLYSEYKLRDPLPGHPTKSERLRETKLKAAEFRMYGYLFAVGHALYCREKFAESARCFEYVFTRYPVKEAYNNFGVCRLQEIIRLSKKNPVSYFALPFEVDPYNRLLRMDGRGGSPGAALTSLLKEAEAAFNQAIDMDNRYQTAYLNLAITGLLTGNQYATLGTLKKLQIQSGTDLPPNGYLIQAIAYQGLNDLTNAGNSLHKAIVRKAFQADYNNVVFQAIKNGTVATLQQPWRRISNQPVLLTGLGCRSANAFLQEIESPPAAIKWSNRPLIEQNTPAPFIVVSYEERGVQTYFRVKMGIKDQQTLQSEYFFVGKNMFLKPKP